jgi:phospholipid/cholesterol/gamma-HCH transport system substrate-binding protein
MDPSRHTTRLAALGLILALAAATGLALAFYTHQFSNPALVTVDADRTGLIMEPGNKVKARGIEIGRVASVERTDGGVRVDLEIDRNTLDQIPANSIPEFRASTIFGAKYVELAFPDAPSADHLAPNATLRAASVTTEINTIFDQLDRLLSNVDVASVNTTLTTLSTALGGRGEQIATLADQADAYLTALEPHLPQLRRDLEQVATFSKIADDVSPDFLAVLDNATVTSHTIATHQEKFDRLLVSLALLADRGANFIDDQGGPLATLIKNLQIPTKTLRTYAPEVPCFIQGSERTREIMTNVFGKGDAGLRAELSFRSSSRQYMNPKDLPTVPHGGKPNCLGLPVVPSGSIPIPQVGEKR